MMKQIFRMLVVLALACSPTFAAAAPATMPAVPAVLEPLKAKFSNSPRITGPQLQIHADTPLTDEQWTAIKDLNVKGINAGGKGINDDAVAHLATMDLQLLTLDGDDITDECFKSIATMKSLRVLQISHTLNKNFTGTGLALLKDLPALERLGFAGTRGGDPAMQAIGELTQLKEFQSWHTSQTDPLHPHLLKLTSLKVLELGNSQSGGYGKPRQFSLTDETMDTLAQMKTLERIFLIDARLTLPALEKLKALPNLKTLDLDQIDIPPADVQKLREEMPGVNIPRRPPLTADEQNRLDKFLGIK